jgi:hypothetical protein
MAFVAVVFVIDIFVAIVVFVIVSAIIFITFCIYDEFVISGCDLYQYKLTARRVNNLFIDNLAAGCSEDFHRLTFILIRRYFINQRFWFE